MAANRNRFRDCGRGSFRLRDVAMATSGSFMDVGHVAGEASGIKGKPACGRSLRDP